MARGQAAAEAILYGRWNPTNRQAAAHDEQAARQVTNLGLGGRQKYTLIIFEGSGEMSMRSAIIKLRSNRGIVNSQARDLISDLHKKGLLEKATPKTYALSDFGHEVLKDLRAKGKI